MSNHRQQDGNSSSLNNPQSGRDKDRQRQAQHNPGRSGTDGNDVSSQKSGKGSQSPYRNPTDEQKRAHGRDPHDQNQKKGAPGDVAEDRDYAHGDRPRNRGNDDLGSG